MESLPPAPFPKIPSGREALRPLAPAVQERPAEDDHGDRGLEARYQELFDATPQPTWVYDLDTLRFLTANRAALDNYGYRREEFLALSVKSFRPPKDLPGFLKDLHRPRPAGQRLLRRHLRKDGTVITAETSAVAIAWPGSRNARLVTAYDVSERQRFLEDLSLRDRYLAALVAAQRELLRQPGVTDEALNDFLALLGPASGAHRLYFFAREEDERSGEAFLCQRAEWCAPGLPPGLGGPHVRRQPLSGFRPGWVSELERGRLVSGAVDDGTPPAERALLETRRVRSGLLLPVMVRGRFAGGLGFDDCEGERVRWSQPEIDHLQAAATALALALEREGATRALASEKEQLAVTLAALEEGVMTTDLAGRVVVMNRVAEALTGWRDAEARGRPLEEVFVAYGHAEDAVPAAGLLAKVLENAKHPRQPFRTWLGARDGSRRQVSKTSAPLLGPDGAVTGVVCVFRDISAQERLAQEMQRASKLESLGILAGGIAHDFNNILTAVLGNVSLARSVCEHGGPGPTAVAKLDEAERACLRARDLTRQLLTFARGGAPVKTLARLAETIRESVGFGLHGSLVRGRFDLAADLWAVEADTGQLSQVLNNLAINAVQAMPRGGGLEVRAENLCLVDGDLPDLPGGHYVKISLEDDGVGIPAECLEKIFDPFFTTKPTGTGLGLATSYSIVKRHGGRLSVDSVPGVGSVFRVYLPAAPDGAGEFEAPRSKLEADGSAEGSAGGGCRVLVLDDEPTIQELLCNLLTHLGYEPEITVRGEDTVAAFRRARETPGDRPFDAVILDLTVPGGMGGLETVACLREMDPGVRAIVSSGYSNDPIISRYAEHGFSGVLSKPYRLDEMAVILSTLLRGVTPHRR